MSTVAIRELKEQMARDWTLWHPSCRPKGAHSLVDAHGDTPQELLEYAHYLGMVFPEDDTFLWIAEEAYVAPLPPNWSQHYDPQGLFLKSLQGKENEISRQFLILFCQI